jgi:ubiquinone/menaquinone biosynthesis C-methylase UbiE
VKLAADAAPVSTTSVTVATAYDAIAPVYDGHLRADWAMRRQLWRHYAMLFRLGMRVLDVGCGTGTDAIFLARQGVRVDAIDISAGMLAELERKTRAAGLTQMVSARQMAVSELTTLPPASFDGIISAYAALNAVPDLTSFSAAAARLLRPGGRLVVHMLNPSGAGELLAGGPGSRRSSAGGRGSPLERLVPIGGLTVYHWLWSADETYRRFFECNFRLVDAYGLGPIARPAMQRLQIWLPALLRHLERRMGRRQPLRHRGRFFVLELAAP